MHTPRVPYAILLCIVFFFGMLIWLDQTPAYMQADQDEIFQLTDEYLGTVSSNPFGFTELNGAVYFGIESEKGGLWQTDGTEAGTVLVRDLHEMVPGSLRRGGDLLYFAVIDELRQPALWRSDGSVDGTLALTAGVGVDPFQFATLNNLQYFVVANGTYSTELWRSDGTPGGTDLFTDLLLGEPYSYVDNLVASTNRLYFTADDVRGDTYLWESDGTTAGTQRVGGWSGTPDSLTVIENVLYFVVREEEHGTELWRYAPDQATPQLVLDIYPGPESSFPYNLVVVEEQLFFIADDGVHGSELWRSDGTAAGTQLVKDIAPGLQGASINYLAAVNDLLYIAIFKSGSADELWKSDGTSQGTVLVKAIDVASPGDTFISTLTAMEGTLYFVATPNSQQSELWKSDGSAAGTVAVADVNIVSPLTALSGILYFSASGRDVDYEPWISDGTTEGTHLLKDVESNRVGPYFNLFTQVDSRLYFMQGTASGFSLPAVVDGATEPAVSLSDEIRVFEQIAVGGTLFLSGADAEGFGLWKHESGNSVTEAPELIERFAIDVPYNFVVLDDLLFFLVRNDSEYISDIWRSDGTGAGTIQLVDGNTLTYTLYPEIAFDGRVYAAHNNELWSFDGTPAGTVRFVPNGLTGTIDTMAHNETTLYFSTYHTENRRSEGTLWRTNGLPENTYQLAPIIRFDSVSALTPTENALFFTGDLRRGSNYLWYHNSNTGELVQLVETPSSISYPNRPVVMGEQLFFTMNDGVHGTELWTSDGTPEGTGLVKDIAPPELSTVEQAYPGPLFAWGSWLIFGANDGSHGQELWQSDGTTDGTVLLQDIYPGADGSMPQNFVAGADRVYFDANDGSHGRELWQSGAEPGTAALVTDLYPGESSSFAQAQIFFNSTLYFTGDNGVDGQQLFALRPAGAPLALPPGEEPTQPLPRRIHLPIVSIGE